MNHQLNCDSFSGPGLAIQITNQMNPFLLTCIKGDTIELLLLHQKVQAHELDNGFRYACREANWNVIRTLMEKHTLSPRCIEDGLCWAAEQGHESLVLTLLGSAPPSNRVIHFLCAGKLYSRVKRWISEYGLDLSWVDMRGRQAYVQYLRSLLK